MRQDLTLKALACNYFPHASPNTAVKRLGRWIERDKELADELQKTGFRKGCRLLTPIQHELITRHFGTPKKTGGKTDALPEPPCAHPPRPPPRALPASPTPRTCRPRPADVANVANVAISRVSEGRAKLAGLCRA